MPEEDLVRGEDGDAQVFLQGLDDTDRAKAVAPDVDRLRLGRHLLAHPGEELTGVDGQLLTGESGRLRMHNLESVSSEILDTQSRELPREPGWIDEGDPAGVHRSQPQHRGG